MQDGPSEGVDEPNLCGRWDRVRCMTKKAIIVRRSVRHDVALRAQMCVAPSCASLIRLSPGSGVKDGWLDIDAVDFSLGGIGLLSTVFLPRNAVVRVRLYAPGDSDEVVLECECMVRRVVMTDRRPMYHVGTSFHNLSEIASSSVERINDFVAEVSGSAELPGGGVGGTPHA
jgi:hypothetical protein